MSSDLVPASTGAVRSSGFVVGPAVGLLDAGAFFLVGTRCRRGGGRA